MLVCLFDIDGTLLASGGAGKAAMDVALAEVFGVTQPIEPFSLSGRTDRGIAHDQFRIHGIADTQENWEQFITAYVQRLPHFLARSRGRVLPGILELLHRLTSRTEVAVGLLTGNVPQGARIKLSHYGLYEFFAFGSFGDRHFSRDDVARDALQIVQQRLGEIDPADIWVIGDTPLDVRCARAIGARAAAVATGIHSYEQLAAAEPDLLLADLSDHAPLLQHLR
jgi:phosphoglycolate phosphatase-like HAD superfamily hydrolase